MRLSLWKATGILEDMCIEHELAKSVAKPTWTWAYYLSWAYKQYRQDGTAKHMLMFTDGAPATRDRRPEKLGKIDLAAGKTNKQTKMIRIDSFMF